MCNDTRYAIMTSNRSDNSFRLGIYLILAFDIVFAGLWTPLTLGLFWKKANGSAVISSILVGSSLRVVLYYIIPIEY